jgi:hypothetical protein
MQEKIQNKEVIHAMLLQNAGYIFHSSSFFLFLFRLKIF